MSKALGDALLWYFILALCGAVIYIKFPNIGFYYYGALLILFSIYCFVAMVCKTIYVFYKAMENKNDNNDRNEMA